MDEQTLTEYSRGIVECLSDERLAAWPGLVVILRERDALLALLFQPDDA